MDYLWGLVLLRHSVVHTPGRGDRKRGPDAHAPEPESALNWPRRGHSLPGSLQAPEAGCPAPGQKAASRRKERGTISLVLTRANRSGCAGDKSAQLVLRAQRPGEEELEVTRLPVPRVPVQPRAAQTGPAGREALIMLPQGPTFQVCGTVVVSAVPFGNLIRVGG